jgi:hypothetical protein
LALGARVEYREPLQDAGVVPAFPTETLVTAEPSATLRVSRRDDLTLSSAVFYGHYSGRVEVVTVIPKLGWRIRTGAHSEVALASGVAAARDLGEVAAVHSAPPSGMPRRDLAFSPVGGVRFDAAGLRLDGLPVHFTTEAVADYVVDPILKVAGPRGSISARILSQLATTWIMGMEAGLATNLRSSALSGEPDETAIFVSLPVRHPLSEHLLAEFGGRLTERAPSFAAQQFALHQRQMWLYFMLTGTTRNTPRLASP